MRNTRGFEAAQARYDSMLPPEPAVWTCPVSGDSTEDCEMHDFGQDCPEPDAPDPYDIDPEDMPGYMEPWERDLD